MYILHESLKIYKAEMISYDTYNQLFSLNQYRDKLVNDSITTKIIIQKNMVLWSRFQKMDLFYPVSEGQS